MLQPDKLKKLNENAALMAAQGKSREEILAMKDAFIKQFGVEEPLKKKDSSESTEPQEPQAGTMVSPSADGSSVTPPTEDLFSTKTPTQLIIEAQQKTAGKPNAVPTKESTEEDYFTGGFGNFLRGVDKISPIGIGDFVDDIARSVSSGYRQGRSAEAAGNLIVSGANPSDEEITQFIESRKLAEEIKPSAEMQDYTKTYEEEGKGFWGVVKGLFKNPTVIPELIVSSLTSMATNTDAIKAGVGTIIAGGSIGATTGATGGSVVPVLGTGIGAGAGAVAGAEAAIPFAFGAASAIVEMGSTFGELLQEELGGKEMSKENVRAILENPDKLQSIRNKAIARGLVIGAIDTVTGKLATGVGAKILTKSAAKSATGAVTKAAATKAVAAGSAVESLGGSIGETAARAAIGQDMDVSEIALEGLAELPGGIRSTIQAKFAKPSYKINGEKATAEDIDNLIETMTPEQLTSTKIDIKNDYQGREFKIRDKILTNSIKEEVRQANPDLNEPSLNAITELEKQLKTLEGNKTQTGKDKASAIKGKIKDIQENQLQEEVVTETIKTEEDAIQKQTTDESVLRTEQPEVGLQEVGQGNAQGEVVTEQGTQEVTPSQTITTAQEVKSGQKVFDILNRPATLFEFGGSKLEQPLEGDIYQDGQRVIFEDVNKNTYDLGNIDEVSNNAVEDLGIKPQEELMSITPEGKVNIGNNTWNIQSELPTKGIDYNEDGSVKAVSLKDDSGKTVMYEGQIAEDIAYQTLLKEFQTEEQIQAINEILDTDEELNKQLGEAEKIAAETAGETTKPSVAEIATTEGTNEVVVAEVDKIKSDIDASKERLKKAWDKYKTMGIAFDPKNNLARDRELVKSLVEYAYNNIRLGSYEASKLIKDLAEQGFEITRDGARFIIDKASKKVKREINKTVGIKPKATEQKRINKAYAVGVATQRVATEDAKAEIKDLKGQVVDVFKAAIDAIKIVKATAKEKAKNIKEISQQLVKDIRELESTGKITPTQAINMISKFNKVNMLNEVSVSNFVDYMTKVFADAEYDNKIKVAKGKLKNARKNINTKIGIADGLVGPLQKLFSINPELIPESYLEKYLELVDMFGARQAVLSLEEKSKVTKDVLDILDEINNERSAVDDLSYRLNYSDNKVIEDGKLNYAATVKNMLKEGDITEEEAALMTKYKSEIVPQTEKSSLSEEELQQEKDDLVEEVKKSTINADDLPTRTERDAAKKLAALLKSPAVKELSNTQLKNLLKVIDNINNGYFPHFAHLITEEINSINNSKALASSVNKAKPLPLSKLYAKAKSILTRKDAILEMIRRNPLFNIDQVFGDFKTKDIFNSILGKASEAEAKFTSELKAIQLKLVNAEEKIAKSFTFKDKLNANKVLMSKFKMMTYMVQLEYNSNPDSKQVNPAAKFIEATINHIEQGKSQFGEKDAEMLQEILDKYTDDDGNIDVKELYNSFNSAEKVGIKTIQEVNQSLKEKAEHTASVIRGQRINPLSNYIHLNVLSDTKPNDLTSGESFADQYNNSLRPSTKAKSLIERTGKVSPLNFDVFASAQKGAKFVLMDFHLTEPIRTARKTINKTIEALGKVDKDKRRIINAINNSFEEAVQNLVNNSYMETSVGDDVVNYISKQGYRSVLAGTGRFAAEFLSNAGFVIISDPTTFAEGLKHTSILMSPDAPSIMNNVNSKETNRIFPSDTLSGRLIDTNILSQASGIKGGKAKNEIINRVQQIWNRTGKRYKNAVELTADVLITTPDKAIMRPIWFGSFAANFKKQTGQDVDFKKIAANDETYMNENKEAIEKAKNAADERSVITGASNNAFTGILKGTSKSNQNKIISPFVAGFNNFNNFMTRFLIYEYTSARTGIYAAMGNGSLSRRQGIALLGAVTTRMTVYSLLSKALGSGLIGLLFGSDDDEEEEKKSLDKSIGQALTSTFTSLLFNRDFGNATKMIINEGVEKINENYLQELREGDYDPYEDALQYRVVPIEKKGGQTGVYDFVANMSGSYGPAIKTTNLIVKTYRGDDKKEADAIERDEDVKNIRIPLEVLGNAGFIPLYKDIRKEVMKEIYKDLDKPDVSATAYKEYNESKDKKVILDSIIDASYDQNIIDAAEQKKKDLKYKGTDYQKAMNKKEKREKEKLLFDPETGTQYDNEEDLKKYNETLWDENFGPNSDWEQEHQYEDAVDKMVRDALTKKEEEEYNYVKPKKKKKTNSDGTRKRSK